MSFKFFRSDQALCMFDPETFKMHFYDEGRWIESNEPALREDIRLRSVDLGPKEAFSSACG